MQAKRVAVIGAGLWGKAQEAVFADHPGVELVAVCDLDQVRAEALAGTHGARPYAHVEWMFSAEALDVVGIATPDHAHRDVVIAAAEAGAAIVNVSFDPPAQPGAGFCTLVVRFVRLDEERLLRHATHSMLRDSGRPFVGELLQVAAVVVVAERFAECS